MSIQQSSFKEHTPVKRKILSFIFNWMQAKIQLMEPHMMNNLY